MRDTNALRLARENERDPYRRRFTFAKWTRTVTVLDEYRLFPRLREFADWDKARHAKVAIEYLAVAHADRAVWTDVLRRYETLYGTEGTLISGGFRDHWPEFAKDACRYFGQRYHDFTSRSLAHWQASGRRTATWRALNEAP